MLNEYDTTDPTTEQTEPPPPPTTRPIEDLLEDFDDTEIESAVTMPLPDRIHADRLLRMGIIMGLGMIIGAVVWVNLVRGENIWADLHPADLWLILPGIVLGAGFAGITWAISRRLAAARYIVQLLAQAMDLNSIRLHHVILFGVLAAIPEEMFFRGAVQVQFGLFIAALIFGALHAISRLYFVYAAIAGLLLGLLYTLSGTLWLPIGAHFGVDVVMFWLLLHRQNHIIT